jgi:hypothetical protein
MEFHRTVGLVLQHLLGTTGHVMPELFVSGAIGDVVGFRFTRDRRLYLEHVLPYREQRAGYYARTSLRANVDGGSSRVVEESPDIERPSAIPIAGSFGTRRAG